MFPSSVDRGPTQPGYNTVVAKAELSQHEVHGQNFSRHMAPLLTYRALEALRPTRRRRTGDPEAEWYRWFDIEDITIASSRLFWEEERTWPPAAAELPRPVLSSPGHSTNPSTPDGGTQPPHT
ncbi:hypothetical protein Taro_021083 [Colocasia esculenta]|uniref:Uncharacterized protein n=1 Tax=Colocasia esculenta TaxID=4460 RepID=A0A843V1E9_COLES|nr:hypothetical protein [Colocasia esculenta]